jgi:hypothetical protein
MSGNAAQKLLERMRNTQSGWGQEDFKHLFIGMGFKSKEGKKHTLYWHPVYKDLKISVPRHNILKPWVARDAIKLFDELETKEEKNNGTTKEGS